LPWSPAFNSAFGSLTLNCRQPDKSAQAQRQPIGGEPFDSRGGIWNSFISFSFLDLSTTGENGSSPVPLGSPAG
jgi:hypothetical protein